MVHHMMSDQGLHDAQYTVSHDSTYHMMPLVILITLPQRYNNIQHTTIAHNIQLIIHHYRG